MGSTTIRVSLTDDAMQSLHTRGARLHRDPEVVASQLLRDACREFPVDGRHLILDHDTLAALAMLLGGGDVLNGPDLTDKVSRLAGITFHNIRMEFTPGQLEELNRRAERLGLTAEELTRRTVQRMEELFFTHLGVGSAG